MGLSAQEETGRKMLPAAERWAGSGNANPPSLSRCGPCSVCPGQALSPELLTEIFIVAQRYKLHKHPAPQCIRTPDTGTAAICMLFARFKE